MGSRVDLRVELTSAGIDAETSRARAAESIGTGCTEDVPTTPGSGLS